MRELKISEAGTIQTPMVNHAAAMGWAPVRPEVATQKRGDEAGMPFRDELRAALVRLNPWMTADAIPPAVEGDRANFTARLILEEKEVWRRRSAGGWWRLSSRSCWTAVPMARDEARRERLRKRTEAWAERLNVAPRIVRIQRMTRKWGSCSTLGTVTLAEDLADEAPGFQDYVIAHELLHLWVPNHGKVFKALLSTYVPDWREYDTRRRLRK